MKHEDDIRPMEEYADMAKQYWENELMRGQRMFAPPLPAYISKQQKEENSTDDSK